MYSITSINVIAKVNHIIKIDIRLTTKTPYKPKKDKDNKLAKVVNKKQENPNTKNEYVKKSYCSDDNNWYITFWKKSYLICKLS